VILRWLVLVIFVAHAAEPGYVDPKLCRGCHTTIYDSYARTGMARTFAPVSGVPPLDRFVHEPSRRIYRIVGRTLQRTDAGNANLLEKRIDFAIGSGSHSRTFVHRASDGRLLELPVSWYAEEGGVWAMSPGYDRADHSDFRREVTESCLFCHNGYPSAANAGLASGIDCQRCHGPGEAHASGRGPIVNPAKLPAARRLEVCLQCHLESASRTLPDAVRRFGRTTFSYRPGEPLAAYQVNFDFQHSAEDERLTVNNSAYGLMRSRCFLASADRLTCTSCHDPHRPGTPDVTATCRGCHASAHTASTARCAGCHMPKRRTEDAVHVWMTDHRIRKRPPTVETGFIAERHERQTGPVRLLYPATLSTSVEDNLYVAIVTVRSSANVRADIPKVEAAIRAASPTAPEPYVVLADAWRTAGEPRRALGAYRQALDHGGGGAHVYVAMGELLLQADRAAEAIPLLETALGRGSRDVPMRNTLAVLYGSENRFSEAERLLEEALHINSDEPLTWLNVGVVRQALGQKERAKAAYREAIRLQPDFTRARQYLEALSKN
jgi:hypothetical protein